MARLCVCARKGRAKTTPDGLPCPVYAFLDEGDGHIQCLGFQMAYNEITIAAATLLRGGRRRTDLHGTQRLTYARHMFGARRGRGWVVGTCGAVRQNFRFELVPGHTVRAQSALTLGTESGVLVHVRPRAR